ncbi:pantetheine-phosphate adenylyltransferase [Marinitenerispora sediminis]|uniref:Phosphopantetheine adenylyltransferase n=1 Tax=Marinitenerispora sediminis TaxID=1931232 RepID=A0A368TEI7_9ACTN|nr:pantetheine-phosphate adenylyltransferase [Marinitenerispora sediminis]RCV54043.1 pantetheine-phosphate adenylyltransferase [Marinitenerispora sediminis]RCV60807.1 pantetheine-phosphate adenylyltransferase [Marinitenerispora sediminis]RCV62437.1 pantetheine-phosphate adenylyltransferase [Marinitenerispora sediminis]
MRRVVCPGSFDPVTNGHIDIIGRAARQNDEVIAAVLTNVNKRALFSVEEKLDMLRASTRGLPNVRVATFNGLLVDFCRENDVTAIVRSLRSVSDFDYELQIAQMNYQLSGVETLFMTANPQYSFLSSSLVREVAQYGGDVGSLVTPYVEERLRAKYAARD